jgi:hypothetical protein
VQRCMCRGTDAEVQSSRCWGAGATVEILEQSQRR